MKVTYIFCIIIYLLFILRNRYSKNIAAEFTLFSIIAAPGIAIGGRLINVVDILFLCAFAYLFLIKKKKMSFSIFDGSYLLYATVALFSLLINFGTYSSLIVSLMQLLRLFYIPIGALIFNKQYKYQDKREAINSICVYGIWLGIITVIAFLEQGTIYDSIQTMWINGIEMRRAGGVFGESSYLGVITLVLFVAGLYLFRKSDKRAYKCNGVICCVSSCICNILSYTRITNIALILLLIIMIFTMRTLARKLAVIIVGVISILCVALVSDIFRALIVERLGSILNIFNDFNSVSSGRLGVWQDAYEHYLKGSLIFGSGYKNGFFGDNNFIMSLTQMGILGLCVHVVLMVSMVIQAWRKKSIAAFSLFLIVFICSMTCDVLTYYRPMCLLLILFALVEGKSVVASKAEQRSYMLVSQKSNANG